MDRIFVLVESFCSNVCRSQLTILARRSEFGKCCNGIAMLRKSNSSQTTDSRNFSLTSSTSSSSSSDNKFDEDSKANKEILSLRNEVLPIAIINDDSLGRYKLLVVPLDFSRFDEELIRTAFQTFLSKIQAANNKNHNSNTVASGNTQFLTFIDSEDKTQSQKAIMFSEERTTMPLSERIQDASAKLLHVNQFVNDNKFPMSEKFNLDKEVKEGKFPNLKPHPEVLEEQPPVADEDCHSKHKYIPETSPEHLETDLDRNDQSLSHDLDIVCKFSAEYENDKTFQFDSAKEQRQLIAFGEYESDSNKNRLLEFLKDEHLTVSDLSMEFPIDNTVSENAEKLNLKQSKAENFVYQPIGKQTVLSENDVKGNNETITASENNEMEGDKFVPVEGETVYQPTYPSQEVKSSEELRRIAYEGLDNEHLKDYLEGIRRNAQKKPKLNRETRESQENEETNAKPAEGESASSETSHFKIIIKEDIGKAMYQAKDQKPVSGQLEITTKIPNEVKQTFDSELKVYQYGDFEIKENVKIYEGERKLPLRLETKFEAMRDDAERPKEISSSGKQFFASKLDEYEPKAFSKTQEEEKEFSNAGYSVRTVYEQEDEVFASATADLSPGATKTVVGNTSFIPHKRLVWHRRPTAARTIMPTFKKGGNCKDHSSISANVAVDDDNFQLEEQRDIVHKCKSSTEPSIRHGRGFGRGRRAKGIYFGKSNEFAASTSPQVSNAHIMLKLKRSSSDIKPNEDTQRLVKAATDVIYTPSTIKQLKKLGFIIDALVVQNQVWQIKQGEEAESLKPLLQDNTSELTSMEKRKILESPKIPNIVFPLYQNELKDGASGSETNTVSYATDPKGWSSVGSVQYVNQFKDHGDRTQQTITFCDSNVKNAYKNFDVFEQGKDAAESGHKTPSTRFEIAMSPEPSLEPSKNSLVQHYFQNIKGKVPLPLSVRPKEAKKEIIKPAKLEPKNEEVITLSKTQQIKEKDGPISENQTSNFPENDYNLESWRSREATEEKDDLESLEQELQKKYWRQFNVPKISESNEIPKSSLFANKIDHLQVQKDLQAVQEESLIAYRQEEKDRKFDAAVDHISNEEQIRWMKSQQADESKPASKRLEESMIKYKTDIEVPHAEQHVISKTTIQNIETVNRFMPKVLPEAPKNQQKIQFSPKELPEDVTHDEKSPSNSSPVKESLKDQQNLQQLRKPLLNVHTTTKDSPALKSSDQRSIYAQMELIKQIAKTVTLGERLARVRETALLASNEQQRPSAEVLSESEAKSIAERRAYEEQLIDSVERELTATRARLLQAFNAAKAAEIAREKKKLAEWAKAEAKAAKMQSVAMLAKLNYLKEDEIDDLWHEQTAPVVKEAETAVNEGALGEVADAPLYKAEEAAVEKVEIEAATLENASVDKATLEKPGAVEAAPAKAVEATLRNSEKEATLRNSEEKAAQGKAAVEAALAKAESETASTDKAIAEEPKAKNSEILLSKASFTENAVAENKTPEAKEQVSGAETAFREALKAEIALKVAAKAVNAAKEGARAEIQAKTAARSKISLKEAAKPEIAAKETAKAEVIAKDTAKTDITTKNTAQDVFDAKKTAKAEVTATETVEAKIVVREILEPEVHAKTTAKAEVAPKKSTQDVFDANETAKDEVTATKTTKAETVSKKTVKSELPAKKIAKAGVATKETKAHVATKETAKAQVATKETSKAEVATKETARVEVGTKETAKAGVATKETKETSKAEVATEETSKAEVAAKETAKAKVVVDSTELSEAEAAPKATVKAKATSKVYAQDVFDAKETEKAEVIAKETGKCKVVAKDTTKANAAVKETNFAGKETAKANLGAKKTAKAEFSTKETAQDVFDAKETVKSKVATKETAKAQVTAKKPANADIAAKKTLQDVFDAKEIPTANLEAKETTRAYNTEEEVAKSEETTKREVAIKKTSKVAVATKKTGKADTVVKDSAKAKVVLGKAASKEATKAETEFKNIAKTDIFSTESAKGEETSPKTAIAEATLKVFAVAEAVEATDATAKEAVTPDVFDMSSKISTKDAAGNEVSAKEATKPVTSAKNPAKLEILVKDAGKEVAKTENPAKKTEDASAKIAEKEIVKVIAKAEADTETTKAKIAAEEAEMGKTIPKKAAMSESGPKNAVMAESAPEKAEMAETAASEKNIAEAAQQKNVMQKPKRIIFLKKNSSAEEPKGEKLYKLYAGQINPKKLKIASNIAPEAKQASKPQPVNANKRSRITVVLKKHAPAASTENIIPNIKLAKGTALRLRMPKSLAQAHPLHRKLIITNIINKAFLNVARKQNQQQAEPSEAKNPAQATINVQQLREALRTTLKSTECALRLQKVLQSEINKMIASNEFTGQIKQISITPQNGGTMIVKATLPKNVIASKSLRKPLKLRAEHIKIMHKLLDINMKVFQEYVETHLRVTKKHQHQPVGLQQAVGIFKGKKH